MHWSMCGLVALTRVVPRATHWVSARHVPDSCCKTGSDWATGIELSTGRRHRRLSLQNLQHHGRLAACRPTFDLYLPSSRSWSFPKKVTPEQVFTGPLQCRPTLGLFFHHRAHSRFLSRKNLSGLPLGRYTGLSVMVELQPTQVATGTGSHHHQRKKLCFLFLPNAGRR